MRFFPPETCVWTSVTFTKCLYAMLVHRSYQPDQRTGWTLPPMSDDKRTGAELGIKLVRLCPLWKCGPKYRSISFHFSLLFRFWQAIGFELLANEESAHQKDGNYSIEMDPRWNKFLISLKDKGFFQVIWNLSVWNQFSWNLKDKFYAQIRTFSKAPRVTMNWWRRPATFSSPVSIARCRLKSLLFYAWWNPFALI